MELKSYQKKVIADLTRYLELLNETKSDAAAFRLFWQEKSAPALGRYQNVIPGVPNLCFKVPTGGGKTFIACNAVRPIFDALPATKTKEVVSLHNYLWSGRLYQTPASRIYLNQHLSHRPRHTTAI